VWSFPFRRELCLLVEPRLKNREDKSTYGRKATWNFENHQYNADNRRTKEEA
jgi:hypothetical protein